MDLIRKLIDLGLHLDKHLDQLVLNYGPWVYAIIFLIVFCETGLVVTPFLPGDSLLFAIGALSARPDGLNFAFAFVLLWVAAILGDTVNYWIGALVGPKVFHKRDSRWFNPKHLERTHAFYEKYGGKTIILARFLPIIRTFAPFVAGIGRMTYPRFLVYNVSGGLIWVVLFMAAGYFFGNAEIVKKNFSLVIIAIVVISTIPLFTEYLRHRREKGAH
ncbi:MAG: DedA family protein [Verrucomicrobia subdivision 3 bacterium]|nr:DedA family protein [Limisphaerales bacterium]